MWENNVVPYCTCDVPKGDLSFEVPVYPMVDKSKLLDELESLFLSQLLGTR
jgi:hypothetical protein